MGNFEIDSAAYPIGYLNVGSGYKVTDMRSLQCLHSQPIPNKLAVRIAAEANARIRAGDLSLKDGATSVQEWVDAEVCAADTKRY